MRKAFIIWVFRERQRPFLSRVHFEEEVVFYHFTEDMSNEDVGLLDAGRAGGRNDKGKISHFCNDTPIISGEGDRFHSHLFSHFKSLDDVRGAPTGADTNGYIPSLTEGSELFRKDFVKGNVVGDTGKNGGICRKGDSRQGWTVHDISINKFSSQVLGVSSASPISEEKEFVPRFEGMRDQFNHIEKFREVFFEKTCFDFGAFLKSFQNDLFHWTKILYSLVSHVKGTFLRFLRKSEIFGYSD